MFMSRSGMMTFVVGVFLVMVLLTAVMAFSKPSINKTVILQIQKVVQK